MWIGGVRVVITDEDKNVLMLKQNHKEREIWLLPGGGIEEGENASQAAVREVKEETGLDVEIKRLLWHVQEVSEERGQRYVNFFLAERKGGMLGLGKDPERGEHEQVLEEARFMSCEEMKDTDGVYPEWLKEELWDVLSDDVKIYDVFKLRK